MFKPTTNHQPPTNMHMKLSIIGSGYVGLVTGVCLCEKGHEVTLVDIDRAKVDAINAGVPPIHEEGLDALLKKHAGKSLRATLDLEKAVLQSELTMLAAPTPFDGQTIDLSFIRQISEQVGKALAKKTSYHVIVVKSTVVPGTTGGVVKKILESASGKKCGEHFGVGMNPEFLSEGVAIRDFMFPDRIVLGGTDDRTVDTMARLYEAFKDVPILRTNCATAEMIKYASNSLQATMISFSNEIANLCEKLGGIDVVDVLHGVHLMKELSPGGKKAPITSFLGAGCGFGGSCFPKDVKAIVAHGQAKGVSMPLLQGVLDINRDQPFKMIEMLVEQIGSLRDRKIAVLGLAFKPGTDDMRESPSIPVVKELVKLGAKVSAYDPIAVDAAKRVFGDLPVAYATSMDAAIREAEAILLITRWEEFRALPEKIAKIPEKPLLIDGRRLIDRHSVARYLGIGLGNGVEQ
jgi:UDPglucose 6-dehydrogenase/GDP-mannose 6-dehydrogenase